MYGFNVINVVKWLQVRRDCEYTDKEQITNTFFIFHTKKLYICLMKEKIKKPRNKYDKSWSKKYKGYVTRAMNKSLPMTITQKEFDLIISLPCNYCGNLINNGIDRIDSSLGYVLDNCQPCCPKCNTMKWTFTDEELITHIKKILDHTKR